MCTAFVASSGTKMVPSVDTHGAVGPDAAISEWGGERESKGI